MSNQNKAMEIPPEECQICGLPNPVWFAPNDVWNRLVPNRVGYICPTCFASKDFETTWVVIPESDYDGYCAAESQVAALQEQVKALSEAMKLIRDCHYVHAGGCGLCPTCIRVADAALSQVPAQKEQV